MSLRNKRDAEFYERRANISQACFDEVCGSETGFIFNVVAKSYIKEIISLADKMMKSIEGTRYGNYAFSETRLVSDYNNPENPMIEKKVDAGFNRKELLNLLSLALGYFSAGILPEQYLEFIENLYNDVEDRYRDELGSKNSEDL